MRVRRRRQRGRRWSPPSVVDAEGNIPHRPHTGDENERDSVRPDFEPNRPRSFYYRISLAGSHPVLVRDHHFDPGDGSTPSIGEPSSLHPLSNVLEV